MGRYLPLAVALAACYDPTTPQGVVCTPPSGLCPNGQSCGADGMCTAGGTSLADAARMDAEQLVMDARLADAARPDAYTPDASTLPAWHLVQVQSASNGNDSGLTSLAVTLTATTAGDLVVVGFQYDQGATITGVTDNASGGTSTFSAVTGALANNTSGSVTADIWYAPSVKGGATSVTVTSSSAAMYTVVAWEFATAQPATIDTAKQLSTQAASSTPVAPAVTTENAGELVIAIGVSASNVTSIETGNEFTNDSLANQNGWAHITSATAAATSHQAKWDSGSGTYCSAAVAFHVGE